MPRYEKPPREDTSRLSELYWNLLSPTLLHREWFAYRQATNIHFGTHNVGLEVLANPSRPGSAYGTRVLTGYEVEADMTRNVSIGPRWP